MIDQPRGGGREPQPAVRTTIRLDPPRLAARQDYRGLPGQTAARQQRLTRAFKEGRFVTHALPSRPTPSCSNRRTWSAASFRVATLARRRARAAAGREDDGRAVAFLDPAHAAAARRRGLPAPRLQCASSSPVSRPCSVGRPRRFAAVDHVHRRELRHRPRAAADWPYRTWLALTHTGDNHGPPRPDEVRKLLDDAAQKLPGVRVRIGRLSDFSDAISPRRRTSRSCAATCRTPGFTGR